MEAQALFQFTPLLVYTERKKSLLVNIKSRQRTNTKHCRVLAFNAPLSAPSRQKDPKKRVVIIGMGVISLLGNNVDTFYERLLNGENRVALIDKFDASMLPTKFGGQIRDFNANEYIDENDDERLDHFLSYPIVSVKKALELASLDVHQRSKIKKERSGVILGSGLGTLSIFSQDWDSLVESGYLKIPACLRSFNANKAGAILATTLGFMGPNYTISAVCATSNYCLCAAANHIRGGEADLMIAGGTDDSFSNFGVASLSATRALSTRNDEPKTASRPWDKDRDGFVVGEGAGVLVMESLEHAMKRDAPIFSEFLGGSLNCDAYHITNPRPDGFGVSSCMQNCLVNAGVSVEEEVSYINAHGTSTVVGDVAEAKAINEVFKSNKTIKVNSTKSIIGHCLAAAGGMEVIATIKAIQTGWLHPTINQFNLESVVEFDIVANEKQQHEIDVAISNSFGFGGHNSVIAFSAFRP
ncbi:3-oxoacyl-[acyl-carrier-protein] synthase I, chloroplastic-like [Rutidosis leptorrhynchoides]|uniref:3-oxoacyl-[acyl-carrier-protein] synthase I, chloroplastic-like n=1 Tax=Rutidosis leptorrhynchoides TaxID=125765 RepID=UPI003A98ED9C